MSEAVHFDLVVVGGGMAGMSAAAEAARRGARVVVCEIADELGGTARLSTGNIWTVPTPESFRVADPDGDEKLWSVVRERLMDSLTWIESLDVAVHERHTSSSSSTYDPPPIGRNVDIEGYMLKARQLVERSGGLVLNGATVCGLELADGSVSGAQLQTVSTNEVDYVETDAVVVATGGFQANSELLDKYFGTQISDAVAVRANPHSTGGGLSLALDAGAVTSSVMDTFYGVVLPAVSGEITEADYRGLVLHGVVYGVVIGPNGDRLADESAGAVALANKVAKVGRALLVIGSDTLEAARSVLGVELAAMADAAGRRGAKTLLNVTPSELSQCVKNWGYNGEGLEATLEKFDAAMLDNSVISPPRRRSRSALGQELIAIEVQAAMTSTFGGIATDEHGRALSSTGGGCSWTLRRRHRPGRLQRLRLRRRPLSIADLRTPSRRPGSR